MRKVFKLKAEDLRKISHTTEKSKNLHGNISRSSVSDSPIFMIYVNNSKIAQSEKAKSSSKSLWHFPTSSRLESIWWIYTWPIKFVLTLTIPNPKTYRKCYPLTFVMCITWIAANSYMVIWMLSIIGMFFP